MEQKIRDKQHLTLSQIEQRLEELPLLPTVISNLMQLSSDEPSFSAQIERLLKSDPTFTTRLLNFSRHTAGRTTTQISNIPEAILRVGTERLSEMITSLSVLKVFIPVTEGQRNLWIHALHVAVAARLIAQRFTDQGVKPEQAYLAGLLHDIGRFILFQYNTSELGSVDEIGYTTPKALIDAEIEVCGFDHTQLGELACRVWHLPEAMTLLIRDHHVADSEQLSKHTIDMQLLIACVQIADQISLNLLYADPEQISQIKLEAWFEEYCSHSNLNLNHISPQFLVNLIPQIEKETKEMAQELGLQYSIN